MPDLPTGPDRSELKARYPKLAALFDSAPSELSNDEVEGIMTNHVMKKFPGVRPEVIQSLLSDGAPQPRGPLAETLGDFSLARPAGSNFSPSQLAPVNIAAQALTWPARQLQYAQKPLATGILALQHPIDTLTSSNTPWSTVNDQYDPQGQSAMNAAGHIINTLSAGQAQAPVSDPGFSFWDLPAFAALGPAFGAGEAALGGGARASAAAGSLYGAAQPAQDLGEKTQQIASNAAFPLALHGAATLLGALLNGVRAPADPAAFRMPEEYKGLFGRGGPEVPVEPQGPRVSTPADLQVNSPDLTSARPGSKLATRPFANPADLGDFIETEKTDAGAQQPAKPQPINKTVSIAANKDLPFESQSIDAGSNAPSLNERGEPTSLYDAKQRYFEQAFARFRQLGLPHEQATWLAWRHATNMAAGVHPDYAESFAQRMLPGMLDLPEQRFQGMGPNPPGPPAINPVIHEINSQVQAPLSPQELQSQLPLQFRDLGSEPPFKTSQQKLLELGTGGRSLEGQQAQPPLTPFDEDRFHQAIHAPEQPGFKSAVHKLPDGSADSESFFDRFARRRAVNMRGGGRQGGALDLGAINDFASWLGSKAKANLDVVKRVAGVLDPREFAELMMYHPFAPDEFMHEVSAGKGDAAKLALGAKEQLHLGEKVDPQEIAKQVGTIKKNLFSGWLRRLPEINEAFDKASPLGQKSVRRVTLGDAKYAPFTGQEVHPDFKRVLDEFIHHEQEQKVVGDVIGKAVRFGKGNVTAFSLRGHAKQWLENVFQGQLAGHSIITNYEVIGDALRVLRQGMKNQAMQAAVGRNIINGLHGGEFNNVASDLERLQTALTSGNHTNIFQDMIKIQEKLGKAYDLPDNLNKLSLFMRASGWTPEGKLAPEAAAKVRTQLGLPKYGIEHNWLEHGPDGWKVNFKAASPMARRMLNDAEAGQHVDKMFVNFTNKSPALREITKNDMRALLVSRFVTARVKGLALWMNYMKYNPVRTIAMLSALGYGMNKSKEAFKGELPHYQQVEGGRLPVGIGGKAAVDASSPITNYDALVLVRNMIQDLAKPGPEGRVNDEGRLLAQFLGQTFASGPLSTLNPYKSRHAEDQGLTFMQRASEAGQQALIPPGKDIQAAKDALTNAQLPPASRAGLAAGTLAGFTPMSLGSSGKLRMVKEYNAQKGALRDARMSAKADLIKRISQHPEQEEEAKQEYIQRIKLIAAKQAALAKELGQ